MLPDGFSGLVNGDRVERCRASVTQQRLLGYVDGLNAAGIDFATVPIYEIRINDDAEASYWTRRFLKRKRRRPTAIFSMSDRMAFGALQAATQLGLKVPRDLSIIGFDDIPQAAGSTPALTTVRQPSRAKGRMAAAIVAGDLPYTAEFQQLSTELIMRESVAAPRTQSGRKEEETNHGRSTFFPSFNDKEQGSVCDTSDATTPKGNPLTTRLGLPMGQTRFSLLHLGRMPR